MSRTPTYNRTDLAPAFLAIIQRKYGSLTWGTSCSF